MVYVLAFYAGKTLTFVGLVTLIWMLVREANSWGQRQPKKED